MLNLVQIEIWRDPPISPEEWTVAAESAGLDLIDHRSGVNPRTGESMRIVTPHGASWSGSNEDGEYFFAFVRGRIIIDWADADCRRKAEELAASLRAQLRVSEAD